MEYTFDLSDVATLMADHSRWKNDRSDLKEFRYTNYFPEASIRKLDAMISDAYELMCDQVPDVFVAALMMPDVLNFYMGPHENRK